MMEGNMNRSRPNRSTRLLRIAVSVLLAGFLAYPAPAEAQQAPQTTVTGTVTDAQTGAPLAGVTVQVTATGAGAITDASGRYSVQVPADGVLNFTRIGYRAVEVLVAGQTTVNVAMEVSAARLEELVVTGYAAQRRADITSAISSVDLERTNRETSSSVLQRLGGAVPGVTVETSGSPGGRSTVRIRGVSSFQNNNPLYIIDGTPVEESYANFLNPADIESIQVLKDASAASIYGARANNGVVIIETRKGRQGAPQVHLDAHFGMSRPTNGYDRFLILDPLEYHEVVRRSHVNAGLPVPTNIYGDPNNPSVPAYIWPNDGVNQTNSLAPWGLTEDDYAYENSPRLIMPGSRQGTNWWDEVFGTGQVRDVNLSVLGGSATERYNIGFNYFDQEGTARFNRYQRGTVRVNTSFDIGRLTVGENFSISADEHYGGLPFDNVGEGNIIGKNILSQPVVPVRTVGGDFASGKAPGLGNNTNPRMIAENHQNNVYRNTRIFGNAFAGFAVTNNLRARTHLGVDLGESHDRQYSPRTLENSEPNPIDQHNEFNSVFTNWTWNNTLTFEETLNGRHNLNLLVGQEAIRGRWRGMGGHIRNLVNPDDLASRYIQPSLGDPASRFISSSGSVSSLLSFFGKADYNFDERYYLSATVRRDGSSRLGPDHRWGTFPAFSVGWRVSQEPFMAGNEFFTNIMLRAGWGVTGNQNIAAGRTVAQFGGGTGDAFYDIGGSGSSIVQAYRQTALGNPFLQWEENRSTNVGLDLEFLQGRASLELDVYQRDSDNLLFNPPLPATAGVAAPPIVNIGQMRNRGVDFAVGYRGTLAREVGFNVDFNGAHYRNEIVRIDGQQLHFFGPVSTRFAPGGVLTINRVGDPVGSFYGLIVDGIFQNQGEIDALNQQAQQATGDPGAVYQSGAAPGRFRFRDVTGDGQVTQADRTIIGDPHPDFTAGLNLGLNYRNWDFGASLFGTFGNDIFDVQKEFYVFRLFNTNVRRDLLTESAIVENGQVINPGAKYPQLEVGDAAINNNAQPNSFYVEDGSYVRLRSLQVGYTIPQGRFAGFGDVRVYLRGENLFTITGYDGLDPSLPAIGVSSQGMDVRDQARGIDRGVYPTSRTISLGFGVNF
jgi:TonB-dependent starch-binding outer membrane protein SusC